MDGVFSYPLGSAQKSHFTDVTDAVDILYMGISDALGGFNHPLQSLPVLGRVWTTPVCDVSSRDAFCYYNIIVDLLEYWTEHV